MRFDKMSSFECVSNSLSSLSNNNSSVTSEFGNFENTGDWIECESKSFPGRTYFFNLRTSCTTWVKPVSRDVTLPRYRQCSNTRMYDENSTCDIDNQPTIVSTESEDSRQSPIFQNSHNFRKSSKEILAWLYHGIDINVNNCFDDDQSSCTNSFFSGTPYVLRDEQDACSTYKKSFHEVGDHFLMNNDHFDKIQIYNGVVQNVAPTADYLEVELSTPNDTMKIAERNEPPTCEDDDSLIVEKCIVFSSSSSENCYSPVPNDYAPRLPRIRNRYLLKEKIRKVKRRRERASKKKSVLNIPTKIVSELYGTKTISYDPVESIQQDLPPGAKRLNLSDSSSSATSSLWPEKHAVVPPTNYQPVDFCSNMNLSSDSTTSSSCSSCSSCTSSDTSQTTLSNTSKRGQK